MLKFSYRKRRIFRVRPTILKLSSNLLELRYLAKVTSEGSDMTCTLTFIEKKCIFEKLVLNSSSLSQDFKFILFVLKSTFK